MGKNQWVSPRGKKWAVRGEGNSRATKLCDTQAEAAARARKIAKNQKSERIAQRALSKHKRARPAKNTEINEVLEVVPSLFVCATEL